MGKYFSIEELCASHTAKRLDIDNTPPAECRGNMEYLINNVLDPLRTALGRAVNVTSGYRCAKLNAAVGGSKTSAHMQGLAADLVDSCGNNRALYDTIVKSGINYDQVILEKGSIACPQWVHVSIRKNGANRRERLYFNGSKYIKL